VGQWGGYKGAASETKESINVEKKKSIEDWNAKKKRKERKNERERGKIIFKWKGGIQRGANDKGRGGKGRGKKKGGESRRKKEAREHPRRGVGVQGTRGAKEGGKNKQGGKEEIWKKRAENIKVGGDQEQ